MLIFAACAPGAAITGTGPRPKDSETGRPDTADASGSVESVGEHTGETPETGETGARGETGGTPLPDACATWGEPTQTGTVVDPTLDEISDVIPSRNNPGVLWVHEDAGGFAVVYALAPTGETLGTLSLDGAENVDWEDMDRVPCDGGDCLVVGDIGDNDVERTDVALLVVAEPEVDGSGQAWTVEPTRYGFSYPVGPQNAEALTHDSDGLPVILVKHYVTRTSEVYRFPAWQDGVTLDALGTLTTAAAEEDENLGAVTSADVWRDGERLLLRSIGATREYGIAADFSGLDGATYVDLPAPDMAQRGEAAAYDPLEGGYWAIPEGAGAPIWYVPCLG
jgi:hypothetical protein